jgi:lipoprotein-anchoring transpeptidase ErfK/SrfK
MTGDPIEQRLREAFDARAHAAVGESAQPPAPRFAAATSDPRRRTRVLAPLAAAAAVLLAVGIALGVTQLHHSPANNPAAGSPSVAQPVVPQAHTVHVKLHNDDGAQYGVGMPVIAYFSQRISDGRPLQRATVVTVNGKRAQGAWYFEKSSAGHGPIEAHLRLASYWPASSRVVVQLPIKGLSAGNGLTYDDDLTTEFRTGPKVVATVAEASHKITLQRNDKPAGSYPVALGAATRPGIKVIMEKPGSVTMMIDGKRLAVQDAQRLTYGGEYLVAAPWAAQDIKSGTDSSNGSTLLSPADAALLFKKLEIGDVIVFMDTTGTPMAIGSGYGDWNISWAKWLTGGLVRTH